MQNHDPRRRHLLMAGIPLLLIFILAFDSRWLAERFAWGQWVANVGTFLYFWLLYRDASPRLKRTMIIGLFIATAGEVFFSLVVGMYEYRLANIPLYVPPGHTILYAGVYQFIREPWVLKRQRELTITFFGIASAYSLAWFVTQNDLYGLLCYGVFMVITAATRESRLFFLTMYLVVAYLELIGTSLQCWFWHPTLLNKWDMIPSGNPPSGIAVFYFGFDIGCLGVYMLSNLERRRRYDSYKAFRKRKKQPQLVPQM